MGWLDLFPPQPGCLGCEEKIISSHISLICNNCLNLMSFREQGEQQFFSNIEQHKLLPGADVSYKFLDSIISPLIYQGLARDLIRDLKYNKNFMAAVPLSELIIKFWLHNNAGEKYSDIILLPIPLAKGRLQERGFNQAAVIAKLIAHKLSINFYDQAMLRSRETPPLFELAPGERRDVLQGVFEIKNAYCHKFDNKVVVLVDDIITTGSTLREAAKIIAAEGAAKVTALTAATAVRQDNMSCSRS